MPHLDLTGRKFGRLSVIRVASISKHGQTNWLCRCDCGRKSIVVAGSLGNGGSKSCGCLQRELASARRKTHGESGLSCEYTAWCGMIARCFDSNTRGYTYYGKRGITVCKRWRKFENFLKDMGRRPTPKHSLERRNNDGDYKPSNCYWATKKEQNNNRRNTVWITNRGIRLTASQWDSKLKFRTGTVRQRLFKGWSKSDAVTKELQSRYRKARNEKLPLPDPRMVGPVTT